jgi:hypothetical protein
MTLTTVIRDVVLPIACGIVTLAMVGLTMFLFAKGEIGGGVSTLALAAASGFFVYHDVRRLLG